MLRASACLIAVLALCAPAAADHCGCPSNTPNGKVTGGGKLPDYTGGFATFGFVVMTDREGAARGNLVFLDHERGIRLKATDIDVLIIGGTTALFSGVADVDFNGLELTGVEFTVIVEDLGEPGVGADRFNIAFALGDHFYQKDNRLIGGNIQIHPAR